MNKFKVFISQPMSGLSENVVLEQRELMAKYALNKFGKLYIEIVSTYEDIKPEKASDAWYIANALEKMHECNYVLFHPDWADSKGCRIEHTVCQDYDIHFIELTEQDLRDCN